MWGLFLKLNKELLVFVQQNKYQTYLQSNSRWVSSFFSSHYDDAFQFYISCESAAQYTLDLAEILL